MTIMCQCRFIHCNKCTTLVGDVNNGEAVKCGAGAIWEITIFSAHFFCEPKTTLKNKFDRETERERWAPYSNLSQSKDPS